ncbi:unnamed protein product [Parnassius mnemosyne]|uniref:ATP-dependent DNA helicase n=1 Tax=Parnassius mnemosyne TaxID=213953 RepID=A0AAV1KC10_9NEOP
MKLLLIGDGKVPHFENKIPIDRDLGEKATSIESLISKVYPDIVEIENKDYQWMCQRAILAATNSSVDEINDLILTKLPGDIVTYTSIDNVMDQEDAVHYPQEFLNSLNPSGLPPHSLKLKIVDSHYVRDRSSKQYLDEQLNFPILYKLYLE